MRTTGASIPVARPAREEPVYDTDAGPADGDFWSLAKTPMILRLPRGHAAIAVLFVIALFFISYAVGYSKGKRTGTEETRAQFETFDQMPLVPDAAAAQAAIDRSGAPGSSANWATTPAPAANSNQLASITPMSRTTRTVAQSNVAAAADTSVPATPIEPGGMDDPRQPGENYFVLVQAPVPDAQQLQRFMATQQVPCILLKVRGSDWVQVIALRGFKKEELKTAEYNRFREKLLRLGYNWKNEMRGGTDLSDLYPAKYNGPE